MNEIITLYELIEEHTRNLEQFVDLVEHAEDICLNLNCSSIDENTKRNHDILCGLLNLLSENAVKLSEQARIINRTTVIPLFSKLDSVQFTRVKDRYEKIPTNDDISSFRT